MISGFDMGEISINKMQVKQAIDLVEKTKSTKSFTLINSLLDNMMHMQIIINICGHSSDQNC